ncbi:hypothetical protein [Armatimonas sp.]|uniref:hypothetical protein n=1 Tax=Armatimonas sp. TaxID=1872638 RepID=UPI00286BE23A|nr:hypothetical protein [Armatimonas sp.]
MSLAVVFCVLLGVAIALTMIFYSRGYGALSPRSRLYRTAGMVMLCLFLVLLTIFMGREFVGRIGLLQKLALLISIYCLGISLPCIALLDALESFVTVRKAERQVIQQTIEEAQKQRNAQ